LDGGFGEPFTALRDLNVRPICGLLDNWVEEYLGLQQQWFLCGERFVGEFLAVEPFLHQKKVADTSDVLEG
jgi:hypothetical protein